jgi:hypothetical protein
VEGGGWVERDGGKEGVGGKAGGKGGIQGEVLQC